MIDRTALAALHRERFAELPLHCGCALEPGVVDEDEWRDWSLQPTTPDQLRIEAYLDRFDLTGKAILHVGSGNSELARRFAPRARRIVGTTVVPSEVRLGQALALPHYAVLLHNKYRGPEEIPAEKFDFIVDNNPSTFCCCLEHFAAMLDFYAGALAPKGQVVTDRVGLGWTSANAHPRWAFDFDDLAAVAGLAGLDAYRPDGETIVLAREQPVRPGLAPRLASLLRRLGRAAVRRLGGRRLSAPHAPAAGVRGASGRA